MLAFIIPKKASTGFATEAEVEPVTAKTTKMTKTCQLEVMFQRSLKFPIVVFLKQIY